MKVNRSDLLEGCVLRSDVFSQSEKPIMPKKTVLTQLHLEVLKAFNIKAIDVEETLNNGEPFNPSYRKLKDVDEEANDQSLDALHSDTIEDYLEVVASFKEQFMNWQKGQSVAYIEIKTMLSPLIHTFIREPKQVLTLYHYCQKEEYLYHHSVSVALFSALLAKKLKYDFKAVLDIGFSGLLADAGLAKLPPRLLKKTTDLNDYDIKQFKQHPVFGYQLLKKDRRIPS